MKYAAEKYAYLFDHPYEVGETIGCLHHDDVFRYRVKTIKSGAICECEIFPVWNTRAQVRTARQNSSREAQRILNRKNSIKRCCRLADNNFTSEDCVVGLTYDPAFGLPDEAQARRDIKNYIRRARPVAASHGRELKYIYVIEYYAGDGRRTQVHHHVLLSGISRDEAESLWHYGRANADRLQPKNGTIEGLIRYILKSPQSGKGAKRWQGSLNLKKPRVTVADTKLSRRQAERLAEDIDVEGQHIIGGQFPTYALDEITMYRSDLVAGAYIYAKMHKPESSQKKKRQRQRE